MTPLGNALSSALLHFLWQGLVVGLLLWVALAVLRYRSAQARYLVSCGALAIMALLPAITMWAVYRRPAGAHAVSAEVVGHAMAAAPLASANWVARMDAWALPVWSLGVLYFALRLMWGSRQVSVLRRRGEAADDAVLAAAARVAARLGLRRPVRVLMSSLAEGPGFFGPSVVGWLRPVILVPAATLAGLNPAQFEAVLAHEIAHVLRYDYLVNLLQMVVEALLFYHPAVWWASARIRHERELCCDDLAVRACGDAVCYARALTTLERLRASTPALAMGTTSGRLLYRIERLMGVTPRETRPARWPGVVALAAGLACVALTTNWARGQAPAVRDEPGVKVDLGASAVLHRTGVEYPEAAKKKGVQGNVTVQVTVDENGNVSDAHVLSGPEELRKSVLQSILEWHFTKDAAKSERQVGVAFQTPAAGAADPAREVGVAYALVDPQGQVTQVKARLEALRSAGLLSEQAAKRELDLVSQEAEVQAREAELFAADNYRVAISTEMAAAQQKIVSAEKQIEEAQRQIPESQQNVDQMVQQLRLAELQMEKAKAQAALMEEQARVQRAGLELAQGRSAAQIAGRIVKSIRVLGFDDAVGGSLAARLNLRVGDTLTAESMDSARKAVRDFDEHAAVGFVPTADGQVEMRILAPR